MLDIKDFLDIEQLDILLNIGLLDYVIYNTYYLKYYDILYNELKENNENIFTKDLVYYYYYKTYDKKIIYKLLERKDKIRFEKLADNENLDYNDLFNFCIINNCFEILYNYIVKNELIDKINIDKKIFSETIKYDKYECFEYVLKLIKDDVVKYHMYIITLFRLFYSHLCFDTYINFIIKNNISMSLENILYALTITNINNYCNINLLHLFKNRNMYECGQILNYILWLNFYSPQIIIFTNDNFRILLTQDEFIEKIITHNNIYYYKYVIEILNHNITNEEIKIACSHDSPDILKYICEHEVNLHFEKDILFLLACYHGRLNIVKILINKDFDIHSTRDSSFRAACESGCFELVCYLLDHSIKISKPYNLNKYNRKVFRVSNQQIKLALINYQKTYF